MDLKQRTSLKGLLANKNKMSVSKEAPKTQVPQNLPPLPPPMAVRDLLPNLNLKRKRKVHDLKEGEVPPQKGAK